MSSIDGIPIAIESDPIATVAAVLAERIRQAASVERPSFGAMVLIMSRDELREASAAQHEQARQLITLGRRYHIIFQVVD